VKEFLNLQFTRIIVYYKDALEVSRSLCAEGLAKQAGRSYCWFAVRSVAYA